MITAHKYLNLDLSVINISAILISELKGNGILTYDELFRFAVLMFGENAKEVFPYALNFLFLFDKIRYHEGELDAFELNAFPINEAK